MDPQHFPMAQHRTRQRFMTDTPLTARTPLDSKRPWITDPADLPSEMHWAKTLLNPLGQTSRIHFTRAWTLLFFSRVLIIALPMFFGWVVSAAGGDASGISEFSRIAVPVVLVVTVFMSFNIHIKRLYDAGKPTLLAILVFLPFVIAGTAFTFVAVSTSAGYEVAEAKRIFALEHPEEAKAAREAAAAKAAEEAKAAEGEDGAATPDSPNASTNRRGSRGGRRGGPPPGGGGAGAEAASKSEIVLNAAQPVGQGLLMFLDFPLMLWTLLWVARKPRKDTAKEADERRA